MQYRKKRKDGTKWLAIGAALAGFLFGVFLVKEMDTYFLERAGVISDYSFRQIKYREYDEVRLLWYFSGKRMKWAVILTGAAAFGVVRFFIGGISGWVGFSLGFTGCVAVVKFGVKGILMIVLGMLPQGIFYLWGLGVFFRQLELWESEGRNWLYFPWKNMFLGIEILGIGVFMESYVNPLCLRLICGLL